MYLPFVLKFTLLLVTLFACVTRADDDDSGVPPGMADEDKHKPLIRCAACENMVKRVVERMHSRPMGQQVRGGRLSERNEDAAQKRRARATAAAWAAEVVEGACDAETTRMRVYCDDAREMLEDRLQDIATKAAIAGTVRSVPVNKTAEDLCGEVGQCEVRSQIKKQMQAAQDQIRAQYEAENPLHRQVLDLMWEYKWTYIGVFLATLVVAIVIQFLLIRRKVRKEIEGRRQAQRLRQMSALK
jgi:hypothetical protein